MIEEFYKHIADNNQEALLNMKLPKSDVFYIKAALREKFNREFTLEEVKAYLIEEGYGAYV